MTQYQSKEEVKFAHSRRRASSSANDAAIPNKKDFWCCTLFTKLTLGAAALCPGKLLRWMICPHAYYIQQNDFLLAAFM